MQLDPKMLQYYGLTKADLEKTYSSYEPLNLKAKEFFLKKGRISDKIGVVKSGILRSFFFDENGNEIVTQFHTPGTLIISFDSFNNQVPSKENIDALTDVELMIVSYKRQKELYELIPAWNQICKDLSDKISRKMIERATQFQTMSASERYKLFCNENPFIIQKVALKHIASYLGIDIATLSRIRKKM